MMDVVKTFQDALTEAFRNDRKVRVVVGIDNSERTAGEYVVIARSGQSKTPQLNAGGMNEAIVNVYCWSEQHSSANARAMTVENVLKRLQPEIGYFVVRLSNIVDEVIQSETKKSSVLFGVNMTFSVNYA